MQRSNLLTPEERARVTEIQDLLIERYVEQKEAFEEGKKAHAKKLDSEIEELKREIEEVKQWANA